jgi:hypothetical protein
VVTQAEFDTLSLTTTYHDFPGKENEPVVEIRVNGADIRELLPPGDEEAFMPVGLVATQDHWMGRSTNRRSTYQGRTGVLTCACMDFGCGGIAVQVTVTPESVIWSDISHPFAKKALPVGPFRFKRRDYEEAVAALLDTLQKH